MVPPFKCLSKLLPDRPPFIFRNSLMITQQVWLRMWFIRPPANTGANCSWSVSGWWIAWVINTEKEGDLLLVVELRCFSAPWTSCFKITGDRVSPREGLNFYWKPTTSKWPGSWRTIKLSNSPIIKSFIWQISHCRGNTCVFPPCSWEIKPLTYANCWQGTETNRLLKKRTRLALVLVAVLRQWESWKNLAVCAHLSRLGNKSCFLEGFVVLGGTWGPRAPLGLFFPLLFDSSSQRYDLMIHLRQVWQRNSSCAVLDSIWRYNRGRNQLLRCVVGDCVQFFVTGTELFNLVFAGLLLCIGHSQLQICLLLFFGFCFWVILISGQGDHMGCKGSKLGQLHIRQTPSLLCYGSNPEPAFSLPNNFSHLAHNQASRKWLTLMSGQPGWLLTSCRNLMEGTAMLYEFEVCKGLQCKESEDQEMGIAEARISGGKDWGDHFRVSPPFGISMG